MTMLLNIVGAAGGLLVVGLAVLGAMTLVIVLKGRRDEHRRLLDAARDAERQINEIGRQAQAAILGEALRQMFRSTGRHAAPESGTGRRRPE